MYIRFIHKKLLGGIKIKTINFSKYLEKYKETTGLYPQDLREIGQ